MGLASATSASDGGLSNSEPVQSAAARRYLAPPPTTCSIGRTSSRRRRRAAAAVPAGWPGCHLRHVVRVDLRAAATRWRLAPRPRRSGCSARRRACGVIGGRRASGGSSDCSAVPAGGGLCAGIWEAVAYLPLLAIPFFFTGTTAVRVLIVVYAVRTLIGEAGCRPGRPSSPAWCPSTSAAASCRCAAC